MQTFEVFTTDDGDSWEWRLRDAKQRVLAQSVEPFSNRADCIMMIELIKVSVQAANIQTASVGAGRR